jgi:hypothetical protein
MMRIALLFICVALLAPCAAWAKDAPKEKEKDPSAAVTPEQIKSITYEDAADDRGYVAPVARDLDRLSDEQREKLDAFVAKLEEWRPGNEGPLGQRVRCLMNVAAMADIGRSEFEGETAYVIFQRLTEQVTDKEALAKAAAWVVLKPDEGKVVTSAAALGMENVIPEPDVRERSALYAKKLLGRVLGKLPAKRV